MKERNEKHKKHWQANKMNNEEPLVIEVNNNYVDRYVEGQM